MKQETRYSYQKRIKELEKQVSDLRIYQYICADIHNSLMDLWQEDKKLSLVWIARQFKRAWK